MLTRKMIATVIMMVLVAGNAGLAERNYTYVLTVGMDPNDPNYNPNNNYNTINAAIVAMNAKDPPLDSDTLGCIKVYPEPNGAPRTYIEQLNSNTGGNDLPAYCDLIGMGSNISDVQIWHAGGGIYEAGVNCLNDNVVSHLKIYNYGLGANSQNGIHFHGDGTLEDCIVFSVHGPAVIGDGHLIVKGSSTDISTHFRSCINVKGTCEIYDCTLHPLTYTPVGQGPGGITVYGDGGIIDNVTIVATAARAKEKGTSLTGISLEAYSNPGCIVCITNTRIELSLTSDYNNPPLPVHFVQGIKANRGFLIVEDCTIDVNGIENSGAEGDGGAIRVNGVFIGNGAEADIFGNTTIFTSRTVGSNGEEGYEYLLNNGRDFTSEGIFYVDFDTVMFDPNGEGEPDAYDPNYVYGPPVNNYRVKNITQDTQYFFIQDAIDDANDGDVIEAAPSLYLETVDFEGKAITVRGTMPDDWSVVETTIIDGDGINEVINFTYLSNGQILKGFTIRGNGAYCGISACANATIRNCIIEDSYWGIACIGYGSPIIENNKIRDNTCGIVDHYGSAAPIVRNNLIYNNDVGIRHGNISTEFSNNTIVNNMNYGIVNFGYAPPLITNCIVWNNGDDLSGCTAAYSCISDCNDVGDPNTHNICVDPCFIDIDANDFHLRSNSPCIEAGDPNGDYLGEKDIDGQPRVMNRRGEDTEEAVVDIGADETVAHVHNITKDKWYFQISLAVEDANNSDEIVVYPGTYQENIDITGSGITLRSDNPYDRNIVESTVLTRGIQISGGATVSGFTIDANNACCSFGVVGWSTLPMNVNNCIIKNFADFGVYFAGGSTSLIENNIIFNSNKPTNESCGICVEDIAAKIVNNLVYNCGYGIVFGDTGDVQNNTVLGSRFVGVYGYDEAPASISNCIVWDSNDDLYNCNATYSCISTCGDVGDPNITHNICVYPCFVNVDANDFHLAPNSPCINAGDPNGNYTGQTDIDGQPRVLGSRADIGADEYACFPTNNIGYTDWLTMGGPNCWCAKPIGSGYQCDGDADGKKSAPPDNYRIYTGDLSLIVSNWHKTITDPTLNPCADIDHKSSGAPFYYRVDDADLAIIIANWKKKDSGLPCNCPRNE